MKLSDANYQIAYEKDIQKYPQGQLRAFIPDGLFKMSKRELTDCYFWIPVFTVIKEKRLNTESDKDKVRCIVEQREREYVKRRADDQISYNKAMHALGSITNINGSLVRKMFIRR
jgi:hypothetical protein